MNPRVRLAAAAACVLAAVCGCGQKGALYLPDAKPQAVGASQAGSSADQAPERRKTQQNGDPATTQ